jgi:hypothetical protein
MLLDPNQDIDFKLAGYEIYFILISGRNIFLLFLAPATSGCQAFPSPGCCESAECGAAASGFTGNPTAGSSAACS